MKMIGTAKVISGEKTTGHISVGTDTDGSPIELPLLVASGKESGPTVWVIGCVHGDEYGGAASIIRIFQELNTVDLKGTFVGLRSEEHTSELQSRGHLVCRLLLEKKYFKAFLSKITPSIC